MRWNILDLHFILKLGEYVFACYFVDFFRCILLDELLNAHVSTTDSDKNFVTLFNLHINAFLAELVNTFRFTKEHNLHLFALRISINEIGQSDVNFISLVSDVNYLGVFELATNKMKLMYLLLSILELLAVFNWRLFNEGLELFFVPLGNVVFKFGVKGIQLVQ